MIHSIDDIPTPVRAWEAAQAAYLKVCNVFSDRGYDTIHALKVPYEWRARCQGRWIVVQEIQNRHTLTCFFLAYVAGARGSVSGRQAATAVSRPIGSICHCTPSLPRVSSSGRRWRRQATTLTSSGFRSRRFFDD